MAFLSLSSTVHLRIAMKEALLATDGDLMSAVTADGSCKSGPTEKMNNQHFLFMSEAATFA